MSAMRASGRKKRHMRLRNTVCGTSERPRLCVFRSGKYIYAQIIDDTRGTTLVSSSENNLAAQDIKGKTKSERARLVGAHLAEQALAQKVSRVVFDRGGYAYHGRVQALADGAREKGLEF